jgi:acylaminoacyl-peptidase
VFRENPLYLAERVKTSTLIIRSIEDYGTRLDKALPFFTALKLHGVKTKPGEDELTPEGKVSTSVENFKEILNWLDRYVPQS